MNLIGEQFVQNNNVEDKSKKLKKIILILIVIIVICIIAVIIGMTFIKKEKKLVVQLDGQTNSDLKDILRFEEDGSIHIPIRDVANFLGYNSYNGKYTDRSEDTNSCYIDSDQEAVTFEANSDKIEKIDVNNEEVTYFYLDEPVKMIDGKLYTTKDGIEKAFNVNFKYDEEERTVTIERMQYLIQYVSEHIAEHGYSSISQEFNDQKAILKNLVIISDSRGQHGILDIETENTVLEPKYSNIKYMPATGDFLVESNGKQGIVGIDGKDKIKMQYDSIELISQDLKLYVVKKENRYGVINQNENIIIPIDCDSIGIDANAFAKNNIKNKYVLIDKIVPVMKENYWALYDIEGKQLTDFQYNSFGCTSSSIRNTENLLIIPDYNVIVARKEDKYYLLNQYGQELFNGASFDEVYMTIYQEDINYYVIRNDKATDAIKLLEKLKEYTNVKSESNQEQNNQEQSNQEQNNQEQDNQEQNNQEQNNQEQNNQ